MIKVYMLRDELNLLVQSSLEIKSIIEFWNKNDRRKDWHIEMFVGSSIIKSLKN